MWWMFVQRLFGRVGGLLVCLIDGCEFPSQYSVRSVLIYPWHVSSFWIIDEMQIPMCGISKNVDAVRGMVSQMDMPGWAITRAARVSGCLMNAFYSALWFCLDETRFQVWLYIRHEYSPCGIFDAVLFTARYKQTRSTRIVIYLSSTEYLLSRGCIKLLWYM